MYTSGPSRAYLEATGGYRDAYVSCLVDEKHVTKRQLNICSKKYLLLSYIYIHIYIYI